MFLCGWCAAAFALAPFSFSILPVVHVYTLADSIAYFTNPSVYQLWRNYIRAVSRSFSLNTIHVPNVFSSGETGETEMTHQSTHEDEFEVESSVSVLHQSTLFADKDLVRTDEGTAAVVFCVGCWLFPCLWQLLLLMN